MVTLPLTMTVECRCGCPQWLVAEPVAEDQHLPTLSTTGSHETAQVFKLIVAYNNHHP